MLFDMATYCFYVFEEFHVCTISLHGMCYDGFSQGFGAARLADQKQWDTQLNTGNHHKQVLLQCLVPGDVLVQFHILQEHILASGMKETQLRAIYTDKTLLTSVNTSLSNQTLGRAAILPQAHTNKA